MAKLEGFFRGDTYPLAIDVSAYGLGDIAGHVFTFTLKASSADSDAEAALQHVHTTPSDAESAQGRTILTVPSAKTDLVDPGQYHFDLQWTRTPGDPLTLMADGENPDGTEFDKLQVFEDRTRTQQ